LKDENNLTPLQLAALKDCVERGSTRTNEGLVDTLLSGLCSKMDEHIFNGWLVSWEMNPGYKQDGYMNRYTPTDRGREVVRNAS
jgi:hypothetical protein